MVIRGFICICCFCLSFATFAAAQTSDDFDSEGNLRSRIENYNRYLDEFDIRMGIEGQYAGAMDGAGGFELPSSEGSIGEIDNGGGSPTIDCQELIFRFYLYYAQDSAAHLDDPEYVFNYFCGGN